MIEQLISVKTNEIKELEIVDFSDLIIDVEENGKLTLKLLNTSTVGNIKISAKVHLNASLEVIFADFSKSSNCVTSVVNLEGKGAECNWHLAALSGGEQNKKFDISFIHNVGETKALMDNYGVARDKSNIIFTGVNHIKAGAKKSDTKQNAKIIVFDPEARGTASPILKIDENDVVASHGAVVGQLNEDHMFYLMSRGLSKNDARKLITLGYLKPISSKFSKDLQSKIETIIGEVM